MILKIIFINLYKKKKINSKNMRHIYIKEKPEINILNIRIKALDNNRKDNHPLSTANEALPKINKFSKRSSSIATNKGVNFIFKKNKDLNVKQKQKNKSISFLL